jgi:lipid-binding SYLF domain-containing protein
MATLVMTEKGVNALLSSSFKLGGDATIAAGPVGAGAKSDVTADFVSFSRAKGIYGGLNLDGTVVKVNGDWNAAYYNSQAVQPPEILITGKATSRDAVALLNAVNKAAGGGAKKK